jgi:hypothetical protein
MFALRFGKVAEIGMQKMAGDIRAGKLSPLDRHFAWE